MNGRRTLALACALAVSLVTLPGGFEPAAAQPKPEGEMRWALYVTLAPLWFDPGEVAGQITPFWVLYAIHDALVKPLPGNLSTPSLAESWTMSPDQRTYEFKLREGLKFHNGDPFTAEDVRFSFQRTKGAKILKEKVREIVVVDPHRIRFVLHEPFPDFMAFYGTLATGASWVVPKKYVEKVGDDGFKKHPIGLGPYKFVSHSPGVELVMEAFEGYWRKMPSVKRLVFKSVPEATTRVAMLKRGEVDIAYLIEPAQAPEIKRDPNLRLAFSGGHRHRHDGLPGPVRSEVPVGRQARATGRQLRDRPLGDLRRGDARRVEAHRQRHPPHVRIRAAARSAPVQSRPGEAAPGGGGVSERVRCRRSARHAAVLLAGRSRAELPGAVGIKARMRPMERAAFFSAWSAKKLKGICVCGSGLYGNAATRMSEIVPSDGIFAYGGYPDVDALYKQQARELDRKKREATLHQIQQIIYERVRYAPIFEYVWPSAIGPRVEEAALMLIDPYPWSAPLEEVKLKKR